MAELPEDQDPRFYKPRTLWKAFGISSVIMLLFTIWMVLDDYGREWKKYQIEFSDLKSRKLAENIEEAEGSLDQEEIKKLREEIKAAEKAAESKEKEIEKVEAELVKLNTIRKNTLNTYQADKGVWDVDKYKYEAKYGHKYAMSNEQQLSAEAKKALDVLNKELARVQALQDKANQAAVAYENKKKELDGFRAEGEALKKQLTKIRFDVDLLAKNKEDSEFTLAKALRHIPLLDFMGPVLTVRQVVLPKIRDDLNFASAQKVDRCTTCHLAIDMKGFENEKQPFRTHPRLDLILGSTSPHPINEIGCTSCHDGRGQAIDFTRAAHTPQNEEQKKEWEAKYGWHEMHHVEEKMLPLQFTEAKCITCHKQTEYVPRAAKINKGIQTFRNASCYGCHRVEGWDHLRKPAPSLEKLKGKVTRDWFVKWIRDPKAFNERTRMPQVFHLSNMQTPEFRSYQEAEIFAVTDYVYENTDTYTPNVSLPDGSSDRGKQLFGEIGCLGCHQMDDFPVEGRGRFGAGPDLSTVGSKITRTWLNSWLKNPKHYWDETIMPSLRLTNQEISDLSSYLLSKKNPDFDALEVGDKNAEVQRTVLKQYLMRDPKLAPATNAKVEEVLSKLSAHEVSVELGKRAIGRIGCYGCHSIKGFENVSPIGTELTEAGSKLVKKLDFGLLHLDHTRYAWYDQKMREPRIFDRGIAKEYLDTLRMPNFRFNEEESQDLVMFLLGHTTEVRSAEVAKILDAHEYKGEQAMRIMRKYNCQGCHTVENLYVPMSEDAPGYDEEREMRRRYELEARILAHYMDDPTLGPPNITNQGAKVQTDWVYDFLKAPYPLRLALKVRMPTFLFNQDEYNQLIEGWANAARVSFPFEEKKDVVMTAHELSEARKLFKRLQCTNCHFVGPNPTRVSVEDGSQGLAPNFWETHKRLRPHWVESWLKDPNAIYPGTRMPGFWPEGSSPAPDILGGDPKKQIEVLTKYLYYIGQHKIVP